ncbi:non-specific serine/threonine protein kinase [Schaalia cardiffensis F0333]|uniref:non-specific serine/threonine protein kinase n=1 Tax=Schaalia cardiffensis F0333 TaxID=888050 RepID=N6W795_9ACTO|nr:Stk1 family PASTA domain-containing Ser/Thr kinase [Schaalia cardiffensis]ENO18400.1 non-specific serine/threonine protein kinase [Schaalia cardiffensis F0333]
MAEPMAHRLAGRYEVRSLIGHGGMAEVHLGFDTRLSRIVAIKMLRSDLARDSIFQARFRREAQSAASLNHPNIVSVYDTGEETVTGPDGRSISVPYIVMEYVEGHTVKELLSDGTPVPINEAISIVSGILSALEYSHSQNLVHRDIKPGNIMLTGDGKVKVMDFGIARALTDSQATMTQTNAVVGTAQYLSPEQARGEQVDARSDLYSTGVVLFELLTGRPPFTGDSAVAVAYQHVQQLPPTPSSVTPDIPEALDRVVMKALAKDREQRYSSAGSMLVDLMRASRGGNVNAPETAVWAQTQTLTPTQGSSAQGTPTQTLPSTAFQPVATATSSIAPVSEEPEEIEEKKSKKKVLVLAVLVLVALALIGGIWYALQSTTKSNATVAVPDNLVNMTQQDAQAAVEAAGLVFTVDPKKVPSDTVAEGSVVETDPPSGTMVAPGSTVKAKISSGSDSVIVPDNLINMSPEEAKQAVEALGLVWQLSSDQVASDTVENGKIAQVNPSPGSKVKKGQTITGTVSSGTKSVAVPDLTGMTQDQAREALAAKGLKVGSVLTSDDASQREGLVLFSSPEAGTSVNKGESVSITLSSGKVTIPDTIVGYDKSSVIAALQGLTLSVTVTEEYSEDQPAGTVIAVNPAEGSPVAQNSNVSLTVSKGPKPKNQNQPGQNNNG